MTFLVGENGSGKSTIVEAVAMAFGLSPEGGSTSGHHSTRPTESPLGAALRLQRGLGAGAVGLLPARRDDARLVHLPRGAPPAARPGFHEMSHGESFLEVLRTRFDSPGFYCLDEPEAALSFCSTLGLIGALHDVAEAGGQVLCATHSPVLAAMPGATILEVGEWGYRRTTWEELELVQHWKAYLDAPGPLPAPRAGLTVSLRIAPEQRHEHRVGAVPVRPQLDGAGHRPRASRARRRTRAEVLELGVGAGAAAPR